MEILLKELKQEKYFFIFLFFLSLFLRAWFFEFFLKDCNRIASQDSQEYHDVAINISNGNGIYLSRKLIEADGRVYLNFLKGSEKKYIPNFYRLPGYPIFLAWCYKVSGNNPDFAIWIQIFLSAFIPLLIFFLSLVLFPGNFLLAKISSIFSTFYLGFILYSGVLFTESLFLIFFLLFFIFFLQSFNQNYSLKRLFVAGLFLGIATLIRPVGHYVLFISLFLILLARLKFNLKLKNFISLFLGWLLIVSFWLVRNFILTGYLFFHTLPGPHFLNYITSHMYMKLNNCSWHEASEKLTSGWMQTVELEEKRFGKKLNEIECCIVAEKLARKYWIKHPGLFVKLSFYNMYRTVFDLHSYEHFIPLNTYSKFWRIFLSVLNYFYYFILIGFIGFVFLSLFNFEHFCCLVKVLPFVVLLVFITLATGFSRVRLPIEPFLIILSIEFWIYLFGRK
jgi:4-amino-4-deoxy-L-arabinose transferase-like glycosyltransferase